MEFIVLFDKVTEFRQRGMCTYSLSEVLTIALFAVLSGADDAPEIVAYGKEKKEFLQSLLPNLKSIPCADTFYKVFQNIDTTVFKNVLIAHSQQILAYEDKYLLNIDGKVLRGTAVKRSKDGKKARKNDGICMLTAWASDQKLVLGQQKIGAKTNEKTAIPQLIKTMNLEDAIVTIDAVLCTPALAEQIVDKKGDYILAVKGGNKHLLEEVSDWLNRPDMTTFEVYHHVDYVGGRVEKRTCTMSQNLDFLDETHAYKACSTVFKIESSREYNKGTELRKETDVRYYISSLSTNAKYLNDAVRQHWGIENNLHWALDVVFKEDASRIRTANAPENFNTLRKMALQILTNAPDKNSLKVRRKMAGWNDEYASEIVRNFLNKA
jgi:predicted transposase YbfD/YdcC